MVCHVSAHNAIHNAVSQSKSALTGRVSIHDAFMTVNINPGIKIVFLIILIFFFLRRECLPVWLVDPVAYNVDDEGLVLGVEGSSLHSLIAC